MFHKFKNIIKYKPKQFVLDSVNVIIAQGINYLVAGIWGILLARWFGPRYFGVYGFWFGFSSIFFSIGEFGFGNYLNRELNLVFNPSRKRFFFRKHIKVQIIINTVLLLSILVCVPVIENEYKYIIVAISTILINYTDKFYTTLNTWQFSVNRATFISYLSAFKNGSQLIVGFIVHYLGFPIEYFLFIPLFFSLIRISLNFIDIHRYFGPSLYQIIIQKIRVIDYKEIFKKTWVFGLYAVTSIAYINLDLPLLQFLGFQKEDMGILNASTRLKAIVMLASSAIGSVVLPKLTRMYSKSFDLYKKNVIKGLSVTFLANFVLILFFIFISKWFVITLMGKNYLNAVPLAVVFSYGMLGATLTFLGVSLTTIGKQGFLLVSSVVFYLIVPLVKIYLIPNYGMISLAYLDAICNWISLLFFISFILKFLNIKFLESLRYILNIFFFATINFGIIITFKEFGVNDIVLIVTLIISLLITSIGFKLIDKETIYLIIRKNN